MKLRIGSDELKAGMALAGRAVSRKSPLPIMKTLMLRANGTVELAGANAEHTVVTTVHGEVLEAGAVCVPYDNFASFVGNLSGDVSLEVQGGRLQVRTPHSSARFPLLPAEEFTTLDERVPGIVLDGPHFRGLLSRVAVARGTDPKTPLFTGVELACDKHGEGTLSATNGICMAHAKLGHCEGSVEMSYILPAGTVDAVTRMTGATVQIGYANSRLVFSDDLTVVGSGLIAGEYPNLKRMLVEKTAITVVAETDPLRWALEQAMVFGGEANNYLTLEIGDGVLVLTGEAGEAGRSAAECAATVDGPHLTLGVNGKQMLDGLRAVDNPSVSLHFDSQTRPVYMRRTPDDCTFQYVSVPMQLRRKA